MNIPTQALPTPLPANPFEILVDWFKQARLDAAQPNPDSMVLATVGPGGRPSARVVLCKQIEAARGAVVFYTNYESRKGRELAQSGRAAVVFHWDHRHRQVRIEGLIERVDDSQSEEYFSSRPWQSKLGAWASRQSRPVESLAALRRQVAESAQRFRIPYAGPGTPEPQTIPVEIPRPPHWGGFRLTADSIELWIEGEFRIHERVLWQRASPQDSWIPVRLQP